jgi:hypothetical protein
MLRLLDGNKRLLVVLGFIIAGFVQLLTGQDVGQWIGLFLRAFGWTDPALIDTAKAVAGKVAPMLFAIWAAAHSLWKMYRQWKAGASLSELNSTAGVVKAAIADGSLKAGKQGQLVVK